MISKDLFEAVYNCDIIKDKDMLRVYQNANIYEFAYKCKEWALAYGYIIDSRIRDYCVDEGFVVVYKNNWTSEFSEHYLKSFSSSTEIEAIIKASEWILKESEKTT